MDTTLKCLVVATSLAVCNMAGAAVVGTLTYIKPTGTALTTDTIEVWARLTLAADSDAITYNPDIAGTFGLGALLPATGSSDVEDDVPFASYTGAFLRVGRSCSGTFADGCLSTQYTIDQGTSTWFDIEKPFALQAGESRDFLLATITPKNGAAAPGIYTAYGMSIGIGIEGLDANGNALSADALSFNTCPEGNDPSCAFTRTVTDNLSEVPVPAAAWLFGSGLLGLAGIGRRTRA